jgi:hypothetical protein
LGGHSPSAATTRRHTQSGTGAVVVAPVLRARFLRRPPVPSLASELRSLVLRPFAPPPLCGFSATTASADFFRALTRRISPGKAQNLFPRAARLYLMRLDDLCASLFRASLPPAPGLSASSCSYGRGFAFRFFQLHLAATPCGSAAVAIIGSDWLLSSNWILPMLGTPGCAPQARSVASPVAGTTFRTRAASGVTLPDRRICLGQIGGRRWSRRGQQGPLDSPVRVATAITSGLPTYASDGCPGRH